MFSAWNLDFITITLIPKEVTEHQEHDERKFIFNKSLEGGISNEIDLYAVGFSSPKPKIKLGTQRTLQEEVTDPTTPEQLDSVYLGPQQDDPFNNVVKSPDEHQSINYSTTITTSTTTKILGEDEDLKTEENIVEPSNIQMVESVPTIDFLDEEIKLGDTKTIEDPKSSSTSTRPERISTEENIVEPLNISTVESVPTIDFLDEEIKRGDTKTTND